MATIGTLLFTLINGRRVGADEFGNRYYCARCTPRGQRTKRWVIYRSVDEASGVPPAWNAWLHHNGDLVPSEGAPRAKSWERPHVPNLTGTNAAYRPPGDILRGGRRAPATGDYEPWKPD
jgi:NADH:ubiquinone oxidoreductase subunit